MIAKGNCKRAIPKTLVRSIPIVESNVLTEDVIEVTPAEADEVIQAFTLERADPRFRESVRIAGLHQCLHGANTCTIEQSIKRRRELRVTITDQELSFDPFVIQPHLHVPRLLHHPSPVGMESGRAHEDLPRLQVNEEQAGLDRHCEPPPSVQQTTA